MPPCVNIKYCTKSPHQLICSYLTGFVVLGTNVFLLQNLWSQRMFKTSTFNAVSFSDILKFKKLMHAMRGHPVPDIYWLIGKDLISITASYSLPYKIDEGSRHMHTRVLYT